MRLSAPAPLLFQTPYGGENRAITADSARRDAHMPLRAHRSVDPPGRRPLRYTRTTSAGCSSPTPSSRLPPHIAQVIARHRDINVTIGYKALYPDEGHPGPPGFLARRRALAPPRSTGVPPTRNGRTSSAISNAGKGPSTGTCARGGGVSGPPHPRTCPLTHNLRFLLPQAGFLQWKPLPCPGNDRNRETRG